MVKLLVKKEMKNLFRTYFINQKSGKGYSKGKTISFILLFVFLIFIMMGMFAGMGFGLSPLISSGLGWFYFAIMGMLALALGVFGDVFNTYSMLYKAKDNEMLLSLPIPPSRILISRMVVVFLLGLLYESMVFIPAVAVFWISGGSSVVPVFPALLYQILVFLFLGIFITTLTCILGWLVALLSTKLKHKNIAVIVLSVVFFGAYYFFCTKLSNFITSLIMNAEAFSRNIRSGFYPAYAFGMAGVGDTLDTIVFAAFSIVTFAICVYVLSISFKKITTSSDRSEKKKYTGLKGKRVSQYWALWKLEGKRFISIPTYALNAGLGIIIMPVLAVVLIFKAKDVMPLLEMIKTTEYAPLIPMVASAMMASIISVDCGAAPSMSLEGKNIWILRSSPLDGKLLMRSKIDFHFSVNAFPALILAVVGTIMLKMEALDMVLVIVYTLGFSYLISSFGMMMGTIRANIDWTNPVVPIKQSMAVMIVLFSGWVLAIAYPGLWYLMRSFMPPVIWKIAMTALLLVLDVLTYLWCINEGVKKFKEL